MTQQGVTTHLSTGRGRTSGARVPLTDDEILRRYGPTLWDAYRAFATDARYATEMVEAAKFVDIKRRTAEEART